MPMSLLQYVTKYNSRPPIKRQCANHQIVLKWSLTASNLHAHKKINYLRTGNHLRQKFFFEKDIHLQLSTLIGQFVKKAT